MTVAVHDRFNRRHCRILRQLHYRYLSPKLGSNFEQNCLYCSRYILRHENCKHWVHLNYGSLDIYGTLCFDPIDSRLEVVLGAINLARVFDCCVCGVRSDFDKIEIIQIT